jgi:hypothetical protein
LNVVNPEHYPACSGAACPPAIDRSCEEGYEHEWKAWVLSWECPGECVVYCVRCGVETACEVEYHDYSYKIFSGRQWQ